MAAKIPLNNKNTDILRFQANSQGNTANSVMKITHLMKKA
jgi:hypothetical protein